MKLRFFASLLTVIVAAALVGGATLAWFTSQAATERVTFTAGTLKVSISGAGETAVDFGQMDNMAPGDETETAKIVIKNEGTLPMAMWARWEYSGSEYLARQLEVIQYTVNDWSTQGPLDMTGHPHWSTWRWDSDGDGHVSLYDLCKREKPYGNGWFGLVLKPGETHEIDVRFLLREDTGNSAQDKSAAVRLRVMATQPNQAAVDALFAERTDGPTNFYNYAAQLADERH